MNPAQLLEHFDRLSEAPGAVPRLRTFILDLAVRGKLVEQDPKDEPTSMLLKRIEDWLRRRRKDDDFNEPRNALEIPIESLPFSVPSSWQWARLIEMADVSYGFAFESQHFNAGKVGMPLIRIRDISGTDTEAYYDGPFEEAYVVRSGDYLVGMDGDFNVRKWLGPNALLNQRVMRIKGWQADLIAEFLAIPLQMIVDHLHASTSQTTVKHLSAKQANGIYLPIPPCAEQKRIVARVDELMALCDRLEAAQAERERRRDRLAAASLHRLNRPADAGDNLAQHEDARFHLSHLTSLTIRPDQIPALRETILNLAVRGQLVPQDPSDEHASLLFRRLTGAIQHFSRECRIAAPRPEPVDAEVLPYPAPLGWIWVRLCSLFNVITDGDHLPPPKSEDGVAFLTIGNVTTGRLNFSNCRFVPLEYFESVAEYRRPSRGDILYTVVGATYGRPAFVDTSRGFCVQRHIAILKPANEVDVTFLCRLLASPLVYKQATRGATGTAQPTIPLRALRNFLVPLPPLAEQHRIVAKVDELMALCDRLEAQLTVTQAESHRLLDAVLHEALVVSA